VRTKNANGYGEYVTCTGSVILQDATLPAPPTVTDPTVVITSDATAVTVYNTWIKAMTSSSITVKWSGATGTPTKYMVRYCSANDSTTGCKAPIEVAPATVNNVLGDVPEEKVITGFNGGEKIWV